MHEVRDTMRVEEYDVLFSERDKFCYGVSVIQKRILVVWSKYVSKSEFEMLHIHYTGWVRQRDKSKTLPRNFKFEYSLTPDDAITW